MHLLKTLNKKAFLFITIVLLLNIAAEEKGSIIGYFPYWQNESYVDSIDFSQLTHVCYAFLTPHSDATMYTDLNRPLLEKIIEKARAENTKIMIAFGGGEGQTFDPDTALSNLLDDTTATLKFVSYVMDIVREYNLDGVSNDWEPFKEPAKKAEKYERIMEIFNDSLKPMGKLLTSDVIAGSWASDYMTERSIELSDYMNIMTYVFNSNALNDMDKYMQYWQNTKKVPKEKLNVAIGFFGTPANEWVNSKCYNEILSYDSLAHTKDSTTINNKTYWYNGPNMCKKIVDLAWQKYNGIAIWHLGLDNYENKSLLKVISQRMEDNKNEMGIASNNLVKINASANCFEFTNNKLQILKDLKNVHVYDLKGRLVYSISNVKKGKIIAFEKVLGGGVFVVSGLNGKESNFIKINLE